MSWADELQALEHKGLSPVYLLVGTELALVQTFIDAVRLRANTNQSDDVVEVNRFRYEEEGCAGAVFACQSVSLFYSSPIVILENCVAMTTQPKVKYSTDELEKYLSDPIEGRVLVITVVAEKIDVRKKIVKLAKKFPVIDCNVPKADEGVSMLLSRAQADGIQINRDAVEELWRRAGSVTSATLELQKLWLYTNGVQIELSDVAQVVSLPLEDNVFAWIDGVVKGNLDRSFRALSDVLRSGHDGFGLLALIARQLRLMWYGKVFGQKGYSGQQIAAKAGAHPYAVRVAVEQSKGSSQGQLEALLLIVADAEYAIKSGKWDMNHALDYVILACSEANIVDMRVR
jgi:DNA polymerase-3 subunit delta